MSHHDSHDHHHHHGGDHGHGHHHHHHDGDHSHDHHHHHHDDDHSHDHHHEHRHTHGHCHTHAHPHNHSGQTADHTQDAHSPVQTRNQSALSFPEKLEKLLSHWIQHNDHHVTDYQQWANEARRNGQTAVAESLTSAAEMTSAVTERFRQARDQIKKNE